MLWLVVGGSSTTVDIAMSEKYPKTESDWLSALGLAGSHAAEGAAKLEMT